MRQNVVVASLCFVHAAALLLLRPLPGVGASPGAALSPVFGIAVPEGYRAWPLVAVSHRTDNKDELRAILSNEAGFKAFREGILPFPDGTVIVKLAWQREAMAVFSGAFRPGRPQRTEFMVKDSRKYASTGGWGFARFVDGVPASEEIHRACFPCHEASAASHDFVFTRHAP